MNLQLCFFPQYIMLFVLGIIISRRNLLLSIPYRTGITWFKYTLLFGTIFWFLMVYFSDIPSNGIEAFLGHLTWQSAVYMENRKHSQDQSHGKSPLILGLRRAHRRHLV